eukprot:3540667-Amphidinium_carterae.1
MARWGGKRLAPSARKLHHLRGQLRVPTTRTSKLCWMPCPTTNKQKRHTRTHKLHEPPLKRHIELVLSRSEAGNGSDQIHGMHTARAVSLVCNGNACVPIGQALDLSGQPGGVGTLVRRAEHVDSLSVSAAGASQQQRTEVRKTGSTRLGSVYTAA